MRITIRFLGSTMLLNRVLQYIYGLLSNGYDANIEVVVGNLFSFKDFSNFT